MLPSVATGCQGDGKRKPFKYKRFRLVAMVATTFNKVRKNKYIKVSENRWQRWQLTFYLFTTRTAHTALSS